MLEMDLDISGPGINGGCDRSVPRALVVLIRQIVDEGEQPPTLTVDLCFAELEII